MLLILARLVRLGILFRLSASPKAGGGEPAPTERARPEPANNRLTSRDQYRQVPPRRRDQHPAQETNAAARNQRRPQPWRPALT